MAFPKRGTFRPRHVLVVLGLALGLIGLVGDRVGIGSDPNSIGVGQLAVILIGVAMIVVGALGRRVVPLYTGLAIVALNTIMLAVVVEVLAMVVYRIEHPLMARWDRERRSEVRPVSDIVDQYHSENGRLRVRYSPFETWRVPSFDGRIIDVGEDGFRVTPGADCQRDSYRIHAFGGSTMWGWGVADSATIPAQLQRALQAIAPRPICVTNLAFQGYVSTQSLARLVRRFQRGDVPDLIVFYDGYNDVYSTYQNGRAGDHFEVEQIASKVEAQLSGWDYLRRGAANLLTATYSYRVVWDLLVLPRQPVAPKRPVLDRQIGDLPEETLNVYLQNQRMVSALATAYGLESIFFWQPVLVVGSKPLTATERSTLPVLPENHVALTRLVYDRMREASPSHPRLYDLQAIFDGEPGELYLDDVHLNERGNAIVAERMAREIAGTLGWAAPLAGSEGRDR